MALLLGAFWLVLCFCEEMVMGVAVGRASVSYDKVHDAREVISNDWDSKAFV